MCPILPQCPVCFHLPVLLSKGSLGVTRVLICNRFCFLVTRPTSCSLPFNVPCEPGISGAPFILRSRLYLILASFAALPRPCLVSGVLSDIPRCLLVQPYTVWDASSPFAFADLLVHNLLIALASSTSRVASRCRWLALSRRDATNLLVNRTWSSLRPWSTNFVHSPSPLMVILVRSCVVVSLSRPMPPRSLPCVLVVSHTLFHASNTFIGSVTFCETLSHLNGPSVNLTIRC